ncbi:hypothetical protein ACTHGU_18590 [Chitinophagaceae bacterium MMS25-I14]
MSEYANYVYALNEELSKFKINCSLSTLLSTWEGLMKECIDGYSFSLYEFDDEIGVRSNIELLMKSEILKPFSDFSFFLNEISRIDSELRKHLVLDVLKINSGSSWWKNCLPAAATHEFIDTVKTLYGADIAGRITRID